MSDHLLSRLRPTQALVHDAIDATTLLVGEGHEATAELVVGALSAVPGLAEPTRAVDGLRRGITEGVLASVRAVNRGVQQATDLALDQSPVEPPPVPVVPQTSNDLLSPVGALDQLVGALNGAVGDHLAESGNGLDLGMRLRHGDRWLTPEQPAPEQARDRAVVLVHGLATTELCWSLDAHQTLGGADRHFGSLLEAELDYTPLYLRYNTGRPVADNGVELAELLEALVQAWPGELRELVLIGHSMGGLVSRAATHAATASDHSWIGRVQRVICLGTPHAGAPLARFGHSAATLLQEIPHPATRVIGRILSRRSAGVQDLRHAEQPELGPLLPQVRYLFVAGALSGDPAHPSGEWLGDLLVPVSSASGPRGPRVEVRHFGGVAHHQLQTHAGVYRAIADWLGDAGSQEGELPG